MDTPQTSAHAEQASGPFVRDYDPSKDFSDAVHIFQVTASPQFHASPAILQTAAHLWCLPYLALYRPAPSSTSGDTTRPPSSTICLVLDSGAGRAVGYILGTSSTRAYVAQVREAYLPTVPAEQLASPPADADPLHARLLADVRGPEHLVADGGLVEEHPAHLHIDILPEFQGRGFGRELLGELFARVRAEGAGGVHLGVGAENVRAIRFYEREGFVKRSGNDEGAVMVRKL